MTDYRAAERQVRSTARVRDLRRRSTDAERALWNVLRNRQLSGAKFRRQHPFGTFILDFFCPEARLVVEVDGGGHFTDAAVAADATRTQFLEAHGLRVVRVTDTEVLTQMTAVREAIASELPTLTLTPTLSQRERE